MEMTITQESVREIFDELKDICKCPLKLIFKEGDNCYGFISYTDNSITLHWNKINKLSEKEIKYIILHELGHEQHKKEILEKASMLGLEITKEVDEFKDKILRKVLDHAKFMETESEDFANEYARNKFKEMEI